MSDSKALSPEEKGDIILDALADALRLADVRLNDRATKALAAIGPDALRFLEQLEAARYVKKMHKTRLRQAMNVIRLRQSSGINQSVAICEAMFAAMQKSNRKLNTKAAAAISLAGESLVPELISRALSHSKQASYCKRLLRLAGQLALSVDFMTQSALLILANTGNKEVRGEAMYVIAKTLPNSPPLYLRELLSECARRAAA